MFPTEVSPNVLPWTMRPLDNGLPLNDVSRPMCPGMSLTELSLEGNNLIIPVQESSVSDIPDGDGNTANLFLHCLICKTIHGVYATGNPPDPLIGVYQQFFTPFPKFLNHRAEKGLSPIRGRANFGELLEMVSHQDLRSSRKIG